MSSARRPVLVSDSKLVWHPLQCSSDLLDSVSDSKFSVKTLASIHPLVMVNMRMTMIMVMLIMVIIVMVIMVILAILIGVRKLCSRPKKVGRGGKRRDKPLSL